MNFNFKVDKQLTMIIGYILLGSFIALVLFFFLIFKTQYSIKDYSNRVEVASGESKRKRAMLETISKFDKSKLEVEAKNLRFSEYVPYKLDTTEFVELLDSFSSEFSSKYGLKDMRIDILPLVEVTEGIYQRQFLNHGIFEIPILVPFLLKKLTRYLEFEMAACHKVFFLE